MYLRDRYEEFLSLVPETGCLEWQRYVDPAGYGRLHYNGSTGYVHRYVWEQTHGVITPDLMVRHKCDNPRCANLEHLELGTALDNAADRDSRGRSGTLTHGKRAKGSAVREAENQWNNYPSKASFLETKRKLSATQVADIMERSSKGESARSVAADHGVHPTAIYRIRKGITYKHFA